MAKRTAIQLINLKARIWMAIVIPAPASIHQKASISATPCANFAVNANKW